jgi:glucosyl-3-phosphoglycerate phosphatase
LRSFNYDRIDKFMTLQGRIFIARHGETVFNAAARMQGQHHVHTPLTRKGFAQADEMGMALANWLGTRQSLTMWSSTAGRALQTLAVIAEHIGEDWHSARTDDRLQEIDVGAWSGRSYDEIGREQVAFLDRAAGLFTVRPPGGEWYDDVATRLKAWIADTQSERGDRLILMHGMSSRVLRGLLLNLPVDPRWGAPVAESLPQGTIVMIGGGEEKIISLGDGTEHA